MRGKTVSQYQLTDELSVVSESFLSRYNYIKQHLDVPTLPPPPSHVAILHNPNGVLSDSSALSFIKYDLGGIILPGYDGTRALVYIPDEKLGSVINLIDFGII